MPLFDASSHYSKTALACAVYSRIQYVSISRRHCLEQESEKITRAERRPRPQISAHPKNAGNRLS